VTAIDAARVAIGSERIAAATVLWAAGVARLAARRVARGPIDRRARRGRARLSDRRAIPSLRDRRRRDRTQSRRHAAPGVAPVAMQQGRYVARTITRADRRRAARALRLRDKGNLATIGRAAAVAHIGRLKLSGSRLGALARGAHPLLSSASGTAWSC
jgi:NADH dehydrogenase